jgi:hypothetical protein
MKSVKEAFAASVKPAESQRRLKYDAERDERSVAPADISIT